MGEATAVSTDSPDVTSRHRACSAYRDGEHLVLEDELCALVQGNQLRVFPYLHPRKIAEPQGGQDGLRRQHKSGS